MKASGRKLQPEDLPPALQWEEPVWFLYLKLQTQVRECGGLDYGPAISLMTLRGWDIELGLTLLQSIEKTFREAEQDERQPASRH